MSTLWKVINCIMFVSDLQQVGGFLWVFSINKTDFHGITKILLKVALNTTNQLSSYICITYWNSICHEWFQEGPFQAFFFVSFRNPRWPTIPGHGFYPKTFLEKLYKSLLHKWSFVFSLTKCTFFIWIGILWSMPWQILT